KEKQQAYHAGILLAALEVPEGSDKPEYKGQKVKPVMRRVRLLRIRQCILPAHMQLINEFDTTNPVTRSKVAMALLVILPTHEIPKEIPAIHVAHLVAEEKPQVITKGWLFVLTEVEVAAVILLV